MVGIIVRNKMDVNEWEKERGKKEEKERLDIILDNLAITTQSQSPPRMGSVKASRIARDKSGDGEKQERGEAL